MVHFYSEEVELPEFDKGKIKEWISKVIASYDKMPGEISYIFCNDEHILEVNRQFLNHDFYTDIITFDYSSSDIVSGDIYISLDTIKSNSELLNTGFPNELLRVIIHGILHLCGFGDKTPEEEKFMHEKEDKALQLIF